MAQSMFRELRDRHQKVVGSQELQNRAKEMGSKDTAGWRYQIWNPKLKVLEIDNTRNPVPEVEMSNKLEFSVEHVKRDVVHRFHCTQRLNPNPYTHANPNEALALALALALVAAVAAVAQ